MQIRRLVLAQIKKFNHYTSDRHKQSVARVFYLHSQTTTLHARMGSSKSATTICKQGYDWDELKQVGS